ncbi:MAG: MATE family efflux transporter, partial [Intestinibacter sp.]|uniref:MATE family efflux transporter n=1 Tax=Intestinibacter sp. TaxID=1965304 RepID=UPI003F15A596
MEEAKQNPMGTKSISSLIFTMGCPPIISMFVQSMYNIIDSIFVAKLGENALTAVSLAAPIQYCILAVSVGVGIGMNSYISRSLGANNIDEANNTVTHSMILSFIHSLLFIVLGLLFIQPFFRAFTDSEEIFTLGCNYTYIVVLLSFGLFFQITFEKIFQATGNTLMPTISQAIGAIANIILDPIFIFGWFGVPRLGVTGAAIATIIGQMISFLILLVFFIKSDSMLKMDLKRFKFEFHIIKEIYAVGIPSALMISISSLLTIVLNFVLVKFSNTAVSVYGIYYRLQTFIAMPVNGLVQGMRPIIGYNYGAKNRDRIFEALKISLMVSFTIMLIGFLLFMFMPRQLMSMFSASQNMMNLGVQALRIISLGFLFSAFSLIISAMYESIGKGTYSLVISLLRQCVIIIPVCMIFYKSIGLTGIWITLPVSEIV